MAVDCDALRTQLAYQTPVYKENFLKDFVSDMVSEPFVGRHLTETWPDGASELRFDKIHVPQPNFLAHWQRRDNNGEDCVDGACNPPRTFVQFGTTRDISFMENIILNSQPFCLDQLRQVPKLGKQIAEIYRNLRKMPLGFMGDFLRTRFASYHDEIQICGSAFATFTPTTVNTDINLSQINLGAAANLPTSELTLTYLEYLSTVLGMRGYDMESGLAKGMRNLVTHSRTFQKLVGLNPEIRAQLHLVDVPSVSPLYKPGVGINAEAIGPFSPTFDEKQVRFQVQPGTGILNRVLPYLNQIASTGEKPIVNPSYVNARYALSYILHPKAALLYTAQPTKVHEMIPSVNSAMWGQWKFHNPEGVIIIPEPDGTTCTKNNDLQWWFYWLCYLEAGFEYQQRELVMPILHLVDGSGKDCMVDQPVCGNPPQYIAIDPSDDPDVCESLVIG